MEILHFCPSLSFSGLEQYALDLATDQRKRGKDVWFAVAAGSKLKAACQERGIPTLDFDLYRPMGLMRSWGPFGLQLINSPKLKVIHLHSTQDVERVSIPLLMNLIFRRHKPKVILQTHIWINHDKHDPFHRVLYALVDEVWCSSEMAKENLREHLPVSRKKIKIIKYGRDVKTMEQNLLDRAEARKALKLPVEGLVIGCVSRIEESKGVREFLEACLQIINTGVDLHAVVIGGPSPADALAASYNESLKKFWDDLDADKKSRLHLLGPVAESYRYLKAFDLYVLPSHQETFSLALLDAQLAELPTVGSRSGGTPEVVREGMTGWLFEPRSVESLKSKISEALGLQSCWQEYGKRAATRVRTDFDTRIVFDEILKSYDVPLSRGES